MKMVYKILLILSTATLGVFLGTQLAEAALIVPYWKNLSANEFFEFYRVHGQKLQ
jgi:nitric oxide reductase large subunit